MRDVTAPEHVEVLIRNDGKVLWVNVDGCCEFRASRISKSIEIKDERVNSDRINNLMKHIRRYVSDDDVNLTPHEFLRVVSDRIKEDLS